jgi:hypothetical protein
MESNRGRRNGRSGGLWRGSLALTLIASGCGGGGESDGNGRGSGSGSPEDGDVPENQLTVGAQVGLLETIVPAAGSFLLRGSLPIPPGVFTDQSTSMPLAVLDFDGEPVLTQAHVVSRYADASEGADVLELVARLPSPAGVAPGQRASFGVRVLSEGIPITPPASTGLAALTEATAALPGPVIDLLSDPEAVLISTRDVFGHRYSARLLEDGEASRLLKHGPLMSQVRNYRVMLPETPVAGSSGTLAHLFGVHAYWTALAEENIVLLDLRVNNGQANTEPGTLDDVINHVYFDRLDISVPVGWTVVQDFVDPMLGTLSSSGGMNHLPLVRANTDGSLHLFPMRAQMIRRLALCPLGQEQRARDLLEMEGLAFSVGGFEAETNEPLWHWSNPITGRYFPQSFPLPSLEFAGLDNVRSQLNGQFNWLLGLFTSGSSQGNYPVQAPRLGWAHPYGVGYGGMTGGDEIHIVEGVPTAMARSREGYRHLQLLHRMHTDRQPNAIWRQDGEPASFLDYLVLNGADSYVPLSFYMLWLGGTDTIGYNSKPTFQVNAAAAQGKLPSYQATLLGFDPHDQQHLIRYTRSPKALAWLGNDSLAKDDLKLQAELFRLSYHPYYNSIGKSMDETSMRRDIEDVTDNLHGAMTYGRGEAWGTDVVSAAYALGEPAWREQVYPWFETLASLLAFAQTTCGGYIMAQSGQKFLDGKYRGAQGYEVSIVDNALTGLVERAFRGKSPAYTALMDDVRQAHYYGFIDPMAWSAVHDGPWEQYAVAPLSPLSVPYCGNSQQPLDGFTPGANKYQTFTTLGYAYQLTEDPVFLEKAGDMIGGDLVSELLGDGTFNVANRAAILRVAQDLAGLP